MLYISRKMFVSSFIWCPSFARYACGALRLRLCAPAARLPVVRPAHSDISVVIQLSWIFSLSENALSLALLWKNIQLSVCLPEHKHWFFEHSWKNRKIPKIFRRFGVICACFKAIWCSYYMQLARHSVSRENSLKRFHGGSSVRNSARFNVAKREWSLW